MKVCGWEIRKTARDLKYIKTKALTEAISKIINLMEKAYIHILMAKFMMANGHRGKKLDSVFGKDFLMILIWGNGLII
jgi:hypothetical protein